MDKYKYHITMIVKTWVDPEDQSKGVDVVTRHDFAVTRGEAIEMIKMMTSEIPGAVQAFGFFTEIEMVEQVYDLPASIS